MSADLIIRPASAPAATPVLMPVSRSPNDAVKTELPPSQAVSAPAAAASLRNNPHTTQDAVSHQVVIDRAAASIVYKVIDERTNEVVEQFPEEAVLRRRAYSHALEDRREAALPAALNRIA